MASRSSFMLKSYDGDSTAKPLKGRQTKVAQHVVKYGGGVQWMRGGGGGHPASPGSLQLTARSKVIYTEKGILLWEAIRCADVLRGERSKFV